MSTEPPLSLSQLKASVGTFAVWLVSSLLGALIALSIVMAVGCATTARLSVDPKGGEFYACTQTGIEPDLCGDPVEGSEPGALE